MKIKPIQQITRDQSVKHREKTLQERIQDAKNIRDGKDGNPGYPANHSQIPAINAQIARLEELAAQGRKY